MYDRHLATTHPMSGSTVRISPHSPDGRVSGAHSLRPAGVTTPACWEPLCQTPRSRSWRINMPDILLVLPQGISILDVSVIHPLSLNTLPCTAATAGAAAAQRDQQKRTARARVEASGYSFVPFTVKTYRRLGQSAILHLLGDEAIGPNGVARA
jgi:hypothetical protein